MPSRIPPPGSAPRRVRSYEVGYGKPPKATQFQPGNQAARRRERKKKSLNTMLESALDRRVQVSVKGKPEKMEAVEAILTVAINRALQGELPYMKFVIALYDERGLAGQTTSEQEADTALAQRAREKVARLIEARAMSIADERDASRVEERQKQERELKEKARGGKNPP